MNSQSYSYSSSSSNDKKLSVSQNQFIKKKINNNPVKYKKSFLRLVQNKNKIKGKMGTKQNNNPWNIVNITNNSKKPKKKAHKKAHKKAKEKTNDKTKTKTKPKKKPNSLKKKGKIQKS